MSQITMYLEFKYIKLDKREYYDTRVLCIKAPR